MSAGMLSLAVQADHVSLTPRTRVIAAVLAILFMLWILDLIRRDRLQERYSVIWFGAGLAMLETFRMKNAETLSSRGAGLPASPEPTNTEREINGLDCVHRFRARP